MVDEKITLLYCVLPLLALLVVLSVFITSLWLKRIKSSKKLHEMLYLAYLQKIGLVNLDEDKKTTDAE